MKDNTMHIFMKEDELTHSTPKEQRNKSHGAYNFPPAVGLHRWMKNALNPILDINLQETYSFTRKYDQRCIIISTYR